jgi:hypothetical protein
MNHRFPIVVPILAAALCAQKVEFPSKATQAGPLRYSLQTKVQTTDTRKMLVNGEAADFGGGRGGGGGNAATESSVVQTVVFDEGPSGSHWREYKTLISTDTRMGRDGEPRETKTEGALQGKKVTVKSGDGGRVTLSEGEGDNAKEVAAAVARGVPAQVSFAGFLPAKALEVGAEYEISGDFVAALKNLIHPVTRAPSPEGGAGAGRRGEGGAQGGGQGGGRQGGQGGARAGGPGGFGGGQNAMLQLLSGGKLTAAGKGKLIGVENDIATIAIETKLAGKGTNEELGLPAMGGGRGLGGGQGGGQGAAPGTSKVDAAFDLKGTVRYDVKAHRVVAVELAGSLQVARESTRTMERDGEEMKAETTTKSTGKVELKATCEAVPAAK